MYGLKGPNIALVTACTVKEDPMAAPRDVAAPPADALKTASGLASKVLIVGLGTVHPNPASTVTVNYIGWTTDGKVADASSLHGGPSTFKLTISCVIAVKDSLFQSLDLFLKPGQAF